MPKITRKATFRMYPTRVQEAKLDRVSMLHRLLYNAALEHRITAYRRAGVSITRGEQEREVTEIRAEDPKYAALNAQSLQVTLKRLDLAYQGFFRRIKAGQPAGFPRFKSRDRWKGFGFKTHGDGWRLFAGEFDENGRQVRGGRIRISGVGLVRIRGRSRLPGKPKTCEIVRKNGKWYASVVLECEASRTSGTGAVANMTRSAKGTAEEPGTQARQKAGLNRSILDGAPATFVSMVRAKAEEAAANFMEAKTTDLAPTQRCHACWKKPSKKKGLSERVHRCEHCGATCGRDENPSRVLMRWLREELEGSIPAGDRAGVGDFRPRGRRHPRNPRQSGLAACRGWFIDPGSTPPS